MMQCADQFPARVSLGAGGLLGRSSAQCGANKLLALWHPDPQGRRTSATRESLMSNSQKILCIHPDDGMLVALSDLAPGEVVTWESESIQIVTPVEAKHKFARRAFAVAESCYRDRRYIPLPCPIATTTESASRFLSCSATFILSTTSSI